MSALDRRPDPGQQPDSLVPLGLPPEQNAPRLPVGLPDHDLRERAERASLSAADVTQERMLRAHAEALRQDGDGCCSTSPVV